jgi:cation diffusion facilitator CzcD-associated flavoprotein CzcO
MMAKTPSVAIIGSGFGGLAAAIELRRHGIDDITVFERADRVGGTWRDNTYPGAACDVPSPIYSFSFELGLDWSARFGTQAEIQRYLEHCARKYDVLPKIRFNAEVAAARFDETTGTWTLELTGGDRPVFDAVICATGQLSRPRVPDIDGMSEFAGAQFHSSRWDHSVSLDGKRVAVVGSGASAIQVVPAIADRVAELHVVQRSPNWVANKHNHANHRLARALRRRFPVLARLEHNIEWLYYESRYPVILNRLDPARSVFEWWLRRKIDREVLDPALRAAVMPDYRLGCNRLLISNDWYPTLGKPHVTLHPAAVTKVTRDALVTADGDHVEVDVIVWCTGFTATEFLAPMRVTGREGRVLHEQWRDDPQAYLGMAVSGYPNFFMLYGPNTNSLTNTIIFLLEKQARYVRQLVERIGARGGSLEVREDAQREFNEWVQRKLGATVFTSGCPGWYTNDAGKVVTMWPGSHVGYARATRVPRFDHYVHRPHAREAQDA